METGGSTQLQRKVLNFLRGAGGKRVEFDLDEASSKLSIEREDLERILFSLQKEGYLKIVKIPPSDVVLEEIGGKLRELDGLFLADEISAEEYLRIWREETGISDIKMSPMPSIDIKIIFDGLDNLLEYLRKLDEVDVSDNVRKKLIEEYNEEILPLAENLRRIVDASVSYLSGVKEKLGGLYERLELIEADSKIRGINREEDLKTLVKEANSIMRGVGSMMKKLDTGSAEKVDERELEEMRKLEEEREVIKAKLLVEGESTELKNRIAVIDKRIAEIKAKLEKKHEEGKGEADKIGKIRRVMSSLHEKGMLRDEIYKDIMGSLDLMDKVGNMMKWRDLEGKVIPDDIEGLKSTLKSLMDSLASIHG